MPKYDPPETGNDAPFVKWDGQIVAFFAHSARTQEQLENSAPGITTFIVPWTEEDAEALGNYVIHICGVTPMDAYEALRRKEPQIADKVKAGILPMWQIVLAEVKRVG